MEIIKYSTKSFFDNNPVFGVLSHESAASYWGFSEYIDMAWFVSVPHSIEWTGDIFNVIVIDSVEYSKDIITEGNFRVYSKERTLVDLIVKYGDTPNDTQIDTLLNYFDLFDFNNKVIYEIAERFGATKMLIDFYEKWSH